VLAQSEWRLAQRAVAAPAAGLVHDTYFVVGDWVPPALRWRACCRPATSRCASTFPKPCSAAETGQAVNIACDGLRAAPRDDRVHRRSRGVHAAVLYSKENRSKLVYLVEAKPRAADAGKLHPGSRST
jgi:HlyD family secretion protein